MSILDALTGNRSDEDTEATEAALQVQRDAERRKTDLQTEWQRLEAKLNDTKQELGEAIYNGDDEGAERLQAQVDQLTRKLENTQSAIDVAQQRIADAELALHRANVAGRVRTMRRLTNRRSKYIAALVEALTAYAAAYSKVSEINDAIANGWPLPGILPEGALLHSTELNIAIEAELALIADVEPLKAGADIPPGASRNPLLRFGGFTRLPDDVEKGNDRLIALVEAGPAPQPLWAQPDVASGEAVSPAPRQVLIDHRKGAQS